MSSEFEGGPSPRGASQDYQHLWDTLTAAQESGEIMHVMVVDVVRGGLVIDLGVRGFVPKSEIATRTLTNLERYIGQTIAVKVTEADRERGRVVLSERRASQEERQRQRDEILSRLSRGAVVEGVVQRLTDFGAFIDIGGIDGLLHISDMSWEHVEHPTDVVSVGETIQVKVLKIERNGERISLGLKQMQEDPWSAARREFRENQLVEATITDVTTAGAFAKVMTGVEGFIPRSEFPGGRRGEDDAERASVAVEPGQTVTVKILDIRPRDRRVTLSIRQAARERERQDLRSYMKRQQDEVGTPTLGDLFGDVFGKLQKRK